MPFFKKRLKLRFFFFQKLCVGGCVYARICALKCVCPGRPEELLEQESRVVVSGLMWVLGTVPGSSVRAVCTLTPGPSLQPKAKNEEARRQVSRRIVISTGAVLAHVCIYTETHVYTYKQIFLKNRKQ